ncbi:nucleotidyl transferase AbiEii/AbiGii toxin family protein [Enterovibrio sp. Hal110]
MTNTYTFTHSLNPQFEHALDNLVRIINGLGVPYFIAGATARDVVLHGIHGYPPIRATRDIDTAILVDSWDAFHATREKLLTAGLKPSRVEHRLTEPKTQLPIDIIPFGAVADSKGDITWPPHFDITMSVAGFQEAYDSSLTVAWNDLTFQVASLPGLALLKLIAWLERGAENRKDATDFFMVLSRYHEIHDGRLWEDYVPGEALGYDVERQGAYLLGFDLKPLLTTSTLEAVTTVHDKPDPFLAAIAATHRGADIDRVGQLLADFWLGCEI